MVGVTINGGFAEYCIIDSRSAAKIPDGMSFEQAAPLMCAGVTIYQAIRKAEAHGLKAGGVGFRRSTERQVSDTFELNVRYRTLSQTIGFVGLGALGTLGVQMAKCKVGSERPCADRYTRITAHFVSHSALLGVTGLQSRRN